ncbi:MAG: hypothetical protein WD271_03245 [Acidimicrobiia bacterium]
MKVELTEYPYFAGTMMTPDQTLLDELASEYAARQGGAPPVMTRFLFADVPVVLFDRIFTADDPVKLSLGSYLWLYHLSGYYGGLWLRGELLKSGHNRMIENVNLPQNEEQFTAEVGDAKKVLDYAAGADVLAYNEQSLFDQPNPDNENMPIRGLVDTFGYNEGYMLQIAEKPPEGLVTPAHLVVCPVNPADGPLFCKYQTSRLTALATFDQVAEKLKQGTGAYGKLAAKIAPIQEPGIARGRMVWDGQLDVQGFEQEAYEQLLDISSAFLETVQATALATVQAVADHEELVGKQAATANAMMAVWLRSYIVGLTDGRPIGLPTFSSAS